MLTIDDAKDIALKCRRRGVVVLAFGARDYAAASWGATRADCAAMKGMVEQLARLVETGTVRLPPGFGSELAGPALADVAADLLAACEAALAHDDDCWERMRRAVAKAKGA